MQMHRATRDRRSAYVLVAMPTERDLELKRRRRGYWLKLARRGKNQAGVAEAIGLSRKSASTISDWERGAADPSLRQLELLAAFYKVPLSTFIDPPLTDEDRLDQLTLAASELEREDWEAGDREDPPTSIDSASGPRRSTG